MIGQTVSHYRIVEKLGQGGMGVVYKAHDLNLDRSVALKFLPPELGRDPDSKARFINEAKAASKLQHENICTIHEISQTDDGQMFIVMDYYEGKTLKQELLELKSASIGETIDTVMQIGRGLQAAHVKGIIHRDIKPSNIIVTPDGTVKILDFGLARSIDHSGVTQTGQTPGTLAYMSPEQATGGKVDHRTDIWSLGVLVYEMVAGVRPFEAEIGPALVFLITQQEPRRLTDIRQELPGGLDRIVRKALEKNPEKRYSNIGELLEDLRKVGEHIAAGGDSRARKAMRRMRKLRVAIPVVFGLLVVASAIAWFIHRQNKIAWAREVLIPQLEKCAGEGDHLAAKAIVNQIREYDPENPRMLKILWEITEPYSMTSNPPGAQVFWKSLARPDTTWELLGTTPLDSSRILREGAWLKVEKAGFRDRIFPSWTLFGVPGSAPEQKVFTLDSVAAPFGEMVRLRSDRYEAYLSGFRTRTYRDLGYVRLGEFLLDRYEVTNREYKKFVDAGGYETEKYWKHPFLKDGQTLSWSEAMREFVDKTGRSGPSTWEGGTYPEGMEDYPVGGLSWYEAAAYAEFRGKRLPTVSHIGVAAIWVSATPFIDGSNLAGKSVARVGSFRSMGPYGTFDLGGNVREWAWNPEGEERYILGGSWRDPGYMYFVARKSHAFDRSEVNGVRCLVSVHPENDQPETWDTLYARIPERKYIDETPVDDRTFERIRQLFAYEQTDLNPVVEARDSTSPEWIREYVTIDAAYGGERFGVYLFIPRSAVPPYQSVIYYPCRDAFSWKTSADHLELYYSSFIIAGGRALIFPVYKGTYERKTASSRTTAELRDQLVMRFKDLARALDYVETRGDFDLQRIAYETYSWGGSISVMNPALEPRIKASIFVAGGFTQGKVQKTFPEIDVINFAPRITHPVLMVTGEYDMLFPYETSQKPAYIMFGTPVKDKKHALLKTDHIISKMDAARVILPWLDRYFGPPKRHAE